MKVNRFTHAPREAQTTRAPAGETATQRTLERLMDLSDLEETRARAAARTVLGGYLTPTRLSRRSRRLRQPIRAWPLWCLCARRRGKDGMPTSSDCALAVRRIGSGS
jgi:hypothetical protein